MLTFSWNELASNSQREELFPKPTSQGLSQLTPEFPKPVCIPHCQGHSDAYPGEGTVLGGRVSPADIPGPRVQLSSLVWHASVCGQQEDWGILSPLIDPAF